MKNIFEKFLPQAKCWIYQASREINFNEENEGNRFLRYVIIGSISEYLESNSEKEKCE